MKQPDTRIRPLCLPQLDAAQAQARNLLAQRVRQLEVPWGDRAWALSLTPCSEPGPLTAGELEWCVQVSWAGVPLDLVMPSATAQAWLRARSPDLDVAQIPEALEALLLEEACGAMTASLESLGGDAARIDRLLRGPAEGRPLEHAFIVQAHCGEAAVFGRLAAGPLGLALLARLSGDLPPVCNALSSDDLVLPWRAELGCTWLRRPEIERLAVGDSVLIEHSFFHPGETLWLACGDHGLRVTLDASNLVVHSPLRAGGWTMQADEDQADVLPAPDSLDQLPLRLVFDLGEVSMPLGQVRRLQVGQSIELGHPLARAVRVRVNGVQVATGELVEIDGHLGVTLTGVARHPAASAPRMTARKGRRQAADAEIPSQAECP